MPRGGKREGAGRRKGSANKKTQDIANAAAQAGITPLEYMLDILRKEESTSEQKAWAAEKAAPYMHPRLQTTVLTGKDGGPIKQEHEVIMRPQISKEEWLTAHHVGTTARTAK
jgi:hypothetical protein